MRHLAESWLRTAAAVGARGDVAGAGADLLSRWVEPHRRYHDLAHLDAVLNAVDVLSAGSGVPDVELVKMGAWFHDAVYDPTATDNEARSALLAEKMLTGMRVPPMRVAEVVRLVVLTATHDPGVDDRDGAVLCDADLAVLAGDETSYNSYVEAVRAEYGHFDDATFTAGRTSVLRSLLDRPTLFRTEHGHATWEAPARRNVAAELERLAASG